MSDHTRWLIDTGTELETADGKKVKIIDFRHVDDEKVLLNWAKHFREHYILDSELDESRTPLGLSRSEYLKTIKFPNTQSNLGPSIIAGDFAEILVADYIEFILNYLVPRTRYNNKINRDSSPQGVDVIGFKILGATQNPNDELMTAEVKASLSTHKSDRFQKAIKDSKKDLTRKAEALNAMRQRLKEKNDLAKVEVVDRFQNKTDRPYTEISAAVLVCSNNCWLDEDITSAVADHPNENLYLFTIKGEALMDLAYKLYQLAYDSA